MRPIRLPDRTFPKYFWGNADIGLNQLLYDIAVVKAAPVTAPKATMELLFM
jgi:hypothetical protein